MRQVHSFSLRPVLASALLAGAAVVLSGCTTTTQTSQATVAEQRAVINSGYDATLTRLYEAAPAARQMVQEAKGVLVFPSVVGASFIVGGEYGRGELRINGQNAGYYSTGGGSIGFQAGAQSQATILLFMTQQALDNFLQKKQNWTIGADANVAIANIGANGQISSNTVNSPVVGFVLNNAGLSAGVSLQGNSIQQIDL
ncbi:YSC84-related protein [Corticimicrobacter populi]|uniref:Twin-arginine translocation pathway signal n=1 Tax=Corticimicrobacter populi TaxID=2175229 RepID=A0A2V1K5L1_9BURK|nr:YSC84-related protein [Corticimicrobacter populi]PWF25523.1 twin-arginine translocation pathway signal [Corticimicrobacter populi]QDQ87473.1 twin-arginine translocation pathway signal [Alcaligenaceae bacterium SJ-26]